ncbi:GPW/gp25 family protein [Yersinia pekkanenii]|uniref:Phage baseplate assembly protein W n=1 Tax=Yersinia pekkanenii TaxID=1288385 RepID=A0A0T9QIN0_9GAMM|nr:GPW/gp25 family protein [Yersinia pekkanenii]CNI13302.1 phage baseplate assembly protein W [Yersinia pekkanenii]CRY68437.1 phage baseplate assembly protein W [Yersinia pekkanenii]
MTARYSGMNRDSGELLDDISHIRQSVRGILITPIGTRVMCREYGSLLSALIDQPQNTALNLQIMAACYRAILTWEPCVRLMAISFDNRFNGEMFIDISGQLTDVDGTFSLRNRAGKAGIRAHQHPTRRHRNG